RRRRPGKAGPMQSRTRAARLPDMKPVAFGLSLSATNNGVNHARHLGIRFQGGGYQTPAERGAILLRCSRWFRMSVRRGYRWGLFALGDGTRAGDGRPAAYAYPRG